MRKKQMGRTDVMVSELCLGTMTYGTQTPEAKAHAQIDLSLERGINFLDTAEMYPVNPVSKDTIGRTEEIIGNWIAATIAETIEGNLRRLKTDYIDLYQFHWPNRGSYMFRKNWAYEPGGSSRHDVVENMHECLDALQAQVDKGTIRHFGLSNESAWGTSQWLRLSETHGLPRVQTMQNEYSLLCRLYDTDMAELSVYEDVGLITFSPLAAGLLSGNYQVDQVPDASRRSFVNNLGGRVTPRVFDAVDAYLAVAQKHNVDPIHMALAWCHSRPFMCSAIFGATTMDQLEHILDGADVGLSQECLDDLNAAHKAHPMPY